MQNDIFGLGAAGVSVSVDTVADLHCSLLWFFIVFIELPKAAPAMKCEFEEKQFETALNHALCANHKLIYAAGQVLENTLGFDAAIFTRSRRFWRLFPDLSPWYLRMFGVSPEGIELKREWWNALSADIEHFPPIKYNVFIQHKRPTFNKKPSMPEWAHWQREFFKYNLTIHQQQALEALAQNVSNFGLVIYASPAFHKTADLWSAMSGDTLINQTNFVEAGSLRNHSSYSYVSGGTEGLAHSEPEIIKNPPIAEAFGRLRERKKKTTNKETVMEWGNIVETVAVRQTPFSKTYSKIVRDMITGVEENNLAVAFYRLEAFCFVAGTDCLFGTDDV